MNIGQAAKQTGLPAKTIRYYEDIGLVKAPRHDNGYRYYAEHQLQQLGFVARARNLGFSVDECRSLLGLHASTSRSSAEVKAILKKHLDKVDRKLRELQAMRESLVKLEQACPGDQDPDCPILGSLAGSKE